jgi:hypothetical protein
MTSIDSNQFGSALYYPYIHPRNINHIKAALLYFDRVRRIVPRDLEYNGAVRDDNSDARILAERDLLVATPPAGYEDRAAKKFLEHIKPRSGKFAISPDTARRLTNAHQGIHIEKLSHEVFWRLKQLGVAHRIDDWVAMHPYVGGFYMFCLASEMSHEIGAPLFSDSGENSAFGQALLFEPDSDSTLVQVLAKVDLCLPAPEELVHIPVTKIAEFSNKRSDERRRFRSAVEDIVTRMQNVEDSAALADFLSKKQSEVRSARADLDKSLDEIKASGVGAFARITIPTGIVASLKALEVPPEVRALLAGTGIVISAIGCYAETRGKLRQAKKAAPYHYRTLVRETFFRKWWHRWLGSKRDQ